jgi:tetratricopeptide (TPR) repeat protein
MKHLIVLIIVLAASNSTYAQRRSSEAAIAVQINGQLRYAIGGNPASNIVVRLEDSSSGATIGETTTDRSGKFHFPSLSQGQYVVSVHLIGFQDVRQNVELETATTQYLTLALVPEAGRTNSTATSRTVDASVPAEAQREFESAQTLVENLKFKEAIQHLEKALHIHSSYLKAELLLGTVYMDLGQWEKAEQSLKHVLTLDPKTAPALMALGEVYLREKHLPDAEKSLLAGLQLDDRSWQGHLTLGRVYWAMGETVKAGPHVGRAIQLKPDLAEAHLLAGNILLKARQPDNALVEFEEYLRLAPKGEFVEETRAVVQKLKSALAAKKN